MTIVSSGAISINSLVGEYGGSAPHSMSEYYKGGSLVSNHSNNSNVPTSGTIALNNFYGQSNTNPAPSSYSYGIVSSTNNILENGFSTTSFTYGTLSNNPQSQAFASGWNPTITAIKSTTVKSNSTITLGISGTHANSGWTSIYFPANLISSPSNQTLYRSGGNHQQSNGETHWTWSTTWSFALTSNTVTIYA